MPCLDVLPRCFLTNMSGEKYIPSVQNDASLPLVPFKKYPYVCLSLIHLQCITKNACVHMWQRKNVWFGMQFLFLKQISCISLKIYFSFFLTLSHTYMNACTHIHTLSLSLSPSLIHSLFGQNTNKSHKYIKYKSLLMPVQKYDIPRWLHVNN